MVRENNMQIISIHLKNIKSHRELNLNFSTGINVLSGPNGIGKSTIFEAIGYAMFGVDAQSFVGNIERFISIGAKKGAISVVFATNEEQFQVSRSVGTPSRWLLAKEVGGEFEVEEHKDSKETEVRLKELLGLEGGRSLAEQFELVIGPFQHDFLGPFVIKQATKRRDKFDEILGIDSWRKTFSETNTLLKAIQNKVAVLESGIGPLQDQVTILPEKREQNIVAQNELKQTAEQLKLRQQELKDTELKLQEIDKCELKIKDLGAVINTLKERIENGTEKIGRQKVLISAAEKSRKIVTENLTEKLAYEQTEKDLSQLRLKEKKQRQLEHEIASLDKLVSTLVERYSSEQRAIEQAGKDLSSEGESLKAKRKGLSVDAELQQLADNLPQVRMVLNQIRNQVGQLDGRRIGLEEGQGKLAEGICPFLQESCQNIAEKPPGDLFSSKFSELEEEKKRLHDHLNDLEKSEKEALAASEQVKKLEVQIKGLDEQIGNLSAKYKVIENRRSGLEGLNKEKGSANQALLEKSKFLQSYSQLQQEIEQAEAQQKIHQNARDAYVANQEQSAQLENLQKELLKFQSFLVKLQEELKTADVDLIAVSKKYDSEQHKTLREEKDLLRQNVGALGQKIEGLKIDVTRLSAEIEKLKQIERDITDKKEKIKAFAKKEDLVKFLRNRVFRNVSGFLSERFREEISQRANRIYRIIAEVDEELAWGDNYQIVLRDMVDGELRERADDQLSGGQTMSAVVALRLAMLQTIGARIAFFDEPTSNLDATRRENLAHAFRAIDVGKEEVTEHWYDQLFLISHDVAFTEVTDQILTLDNLAD
jgi:DNA repair protein SbcC/Rad50